MKKTSKKCEIIECGLKECTEKFMQVVPWQRFCCVQHRITDESRRSILSRKKKVPKKSKKLCRCGCGNPVGKGLYWLSESCYKGKQNNIDYEHKILSH